MQEEWRDVPGFEGRLQASNAGRVRSLRVLKSHRRSGSEYPVVWVPSTTKRAQSEFVHTLVARAFVGPRPSGYEVNHKDGNRQNPRAENLEYLTRVENARDGVRRRGCCLTDEQIRQVDELYYVEGKSARWITEHLQIPGQRVRSYIQICRAEKGRKRGPYEHKLKLDDARRMRELAQQGIQIGEIARMYKISGSHASRVVRGEHFKENEDLK